MIIQRNAFLLKKWPLGSTRSVSWVPHLKWRIVFLFAVFRCAPTDRKSLFKAKKQEKQKREFAPKMSFVMCKCSYKEQTQLWGKGWGVRWGGRGKGEGPSKYGWSCFFTRCQHHIKQVTISNATSVCYIFSNFDLSQLVIVSFSLSPFRFHCYTLFVILAL